jgi:transcriptional regulator with XRE-family HTH domain
MTSLTLGELAQRSGISASHLGRIERGERFPSARILRRLAQPLGFAENELFALAGYLSSSPSAVAEEGPVYTARRLDPYVAKVLSQEPVEVQRAVISILSILRSMATSMTKE